jgi:hypothetical protein
MNDKPETIAADVAQDAKFNRMMQADSHAFVQELKQMGYVALVGLTERQLIHLMLKHLLAIEQDRSNLAHFFTPPKTDEITEVQYNVVGIPNSGATIAWLNRVVTKCDGTKDVTKGPFVDRRTVESWLNMVNANVGFERSNAE